MIQIHMGESNTISQEQICRRPECFQVSEIHLSGLVASKAESTPFGTKAPITLGVLYKKNISTLNAVLTLRRLLRADLRYGGLKDAKSISWQFITIQGDQGHLRLKDLCFRPISKRFTHLSTREVWGNSFKVHITNLTEPRRLVQEFLELSKKPLPAFYGPQRFGGKSNDTHIVGYLLLKKEYDKAVEAILKGKNGWYEKAILHALEKGKTSGEALLGLPKPLLKLFINAYQAQIFNRALSRFLSISPVKQEKVLVTPSYANGLPLTKKLETAAAEATQKLDPRHFYLVGWLPGTKLEKALDEFSTIEKELLSLDGLTPRDFKDTVVGEIVGSPRQLFFWIFNPFYIVDMCKEDAWLGFKLNRGMYATVVLKFLSS